MHLVCLGKPKPPFLKMKMLEHRNFPIFLDAKN